MPQPDQTPKNVKPYVFHGVNFTKEEEDEYEGDCPFCGREGKFGVRVETGQYKCFVCGEDGNVTTFLRRLHETGICAGEDALKLKDSRKLLDANTLETWGLVLSPLTGDWLIPGYGVKGSVDQLYRYAQWGKDKKRILKGTSEVEHALFGIHLFDDKKSTVYICESWNAPALWEVLRIAKSDGSGGLKLTGSEEMSLAADTNVIGVPGANVWKERWSPVLHGKRVVLMIDNDHPKPNGAEGAGVAGARRTAGLLASCPEAPESISVLCWGENGEPWSQEWASGWDVRDSLAGKGNTATQRIAVLAALLAKVKPIPEDWVAGRSVHTAAHGGVALSSKKCEKWADLRNIWKVAMKWTDDLEHMISVFLASILSTETRGEQIWVLAMAPPSSGKTTLCEALAIARDYVHCKSELNKVFSGFKNDKEGSEDFSIIPQIQNKTLVVMDGDAILKDPNRGKILSQYRGLFDGVGRSHFNNGTSRNYQCRFTFILCGTASMREMDASEVGARFINCSFSEHIDPVHEREVNRRVAYRELRNVKSMVNGSAETRTDPDMVLAKQMTGGYVEYLRQNAERLLDLVSIDEDKVEAVIDMGEFVAFMRARQPKLQDEVVEREFSSRLVAQFTRLVVCLAAVLGKNEVDEEVLARVRRTALDTARGRTLVYAKYLHEAGEGGSTTAALHGRVGESEDKTKAMLEFLAKIGVVEKFKEERKYMSGHWKWKLTERVTTLYEEVVRAKS